jgi:hypothetical protein
MTVPKRVEEHRRQEHEEIDDQRQGRAGEVFSSSRTRATERCGAGGRRMVEAPL